MSLTDCALYYLHQAPSPTIVFICLNSISSEVSFSKKQFLNAVSEIVITSPLSHAFEIGYSSAIVTPKYKLIS